MIGLYLNWHGGEVSPQSAHRFAASFGAGVQAAVGHRNIDGGLVGSASPAIH